MFVYCGNNPVIRFDKEGTDWKDWVAVGLGVIVVGVAIIAAVPTGGGSLTHGDGPFVQSGLDCPLING